MSIKSNEDVSLLETKDVGNVTDKKRTIENDDSKIEKKQKIESSEDDVSKETTEKIEEEEEEEEEEEIIKFSVDTLLLDIEGTICPILFVKDKLFPYFTEKSPEILKQLKFPLSETKDESTDESSLINNILVQFPSSITSDYESLINHLQSLVKQDIKDPVLKSLQGFIWKLGYEKGEIVAPVYKDAIELIKKFSETGKVYIYSSGSIKAQKLLFAYVESKPKSIDLNSYLSGYFDITTSGFKQETSSYTSILKDIKINDGSKVLFLSDNVNEVKAAKEAGLNSIIVDRPGNNPLTKDDIKTYGIIKNFENLEL